MPVRRGILQDVIMQNVILQDITMYNVTMYNVTMYNVTMLSFLGVRTYCPYLQKQVFYLF